MEYCIAQTREDALALLRSKSKPKLIAGGTDLAVVLADNLISPDTLVDVSSIPSLVGVRISAQGISIGAATRIADIALHPRLPACLAEGARSIGSPQIRNLATIGGNICNASPCGDTLAPLIALNAVFILESGTGSRSVPADEFFLGPKKTVIRADELLVEIRIDQRHAGGSSAFRMIGKRNGQAISQVNAAAWLERDANGISDVRLAIGSVAPVPLRLRRTEALLSGRALDAIDMIYMKEILAAADAEISPISDVRASVEYRRLVSGSLLRECLEEVLVMSARGNKG
jgi:CO/xanthine dehydrogenase FAD-binding subunit